VRCILGLTATATATTEASIVRHMRLTDEAVLRTDPIPSNLRLGCSKVEGRREELVRFLKYHPNFSKGPAIVYCMRQGDTESLAALLRTNGVDADSYHAGLGNAMRRQVQQRFMKSSLRVASNLHTVHCHQHTAHRTPHTAHRTPHTAHLHTTHTHTPLANCTAHRSQHTAHLHTTCHRTLHTCDTT
jgi:hypothetical protein